MGYLKNVFAVFVRHKNYAIVCTIFYLTCNITFEYISFYSGYVVVTERDRAFVNSLAKK